MRSRAAILPYPGDPFLLNYWLHFFNTVWQDEVDKLYIFLNSPIEQSVVAYISHLCLQNPKIVLIYENNQIEHGDVINRTLNVVTDEFVMLIEDDCFIFKPGKVNQAFEYLESGDYDIVGSKRGSCSQEILSRARQLWGLEYSGEGDQGCNFWPNLFFSKKQTLIDTDRNFAARSWKHGEVIEALSTPSETYYAQDEVVVGDTFVNTSLQLQKKFPQARIKYIPQYHASPDDLEHSSRSYNLFDGLCGYTHIGSLSSGVGGILQDGHGRALTRRLLDPSKGDNVPIPNYCHTDAEKQEFERRVQWWLKFYNYFVETTDQNTSLDIAQFATLYKEAIDRIIREYELNISRIERRQRVYASIGL